MEKEQLKKQYRRLDEIYPGAALAIAIGLFLSLVLFILPAIVAFSIWWVLLMVVLIFPLTALTLLFIWWIKKIFVKDHELELLEMDLDECIEDETRLKRQIANLTLTGISIIPRDIGDHDVTTVDGLAQVLHEAGREAVLKNAVVKKEEKPVFREWDEINEAAREGRRIQARYLLSRFIISYK